MHRKPGSLARNRLHQPARCRCAGRLFAVSAGGLAHLCVGRRVPRRSLTPICFHRVLMTPRRIALRKQLHVVQSDDVYI